MSSKREDIYWYATQVSEAQRCRIYGHEGVVMWLTGLSGSGKSTLAHRVESVLVHNRVFAYTLDGDNLRHGLSCDMGFSAEDRREHIRRIGEVADLFRKAGAIVLSACISPYRADRQWVRTLIGKRGFIEVYIQCALDVCEKRDPKGLYAKARAGRIEHLTGVDAPYEEPENAELCLETNKHDVDRCVDQMITYLVDGGYIHHPIDRPP